MVVAFDIETTGLNPYESKTILIGMKKKGSIRLWKLWETDDEAKMILSAIKEIERVEETILGYNNLKFDVPFLLKRLEVLGQVEPRLWEIYNKKWFDLYQYLGNDMRSLRYWLSQAGIKRKNPELEGKDMPVYFEKREFKKIEEHNMDDLNTSEVLFKFLKERNPEFLRFD